MLSIVIPTRDRPAALRRTLGAIADQPPPRDGVEAIVVDNGGSNGPAAVDEVASGSSLAVSRIDGPGPPAAARNLGVDAARGELILFLNDDTAPASPGFLVEHEALHRRNADPRYAVMGRATWSPEEPISPLMEWLESGGLQFNFDRLRTEGVEPTTDFCTAHVSLKRELLERAGGFDSRFTEAALEDVELGARLARLGIVLDYRPELLVHHSHQTTLSASLDRLRRVGRAAALVHAIHPDWTARGVGRPEGPRWSLLRRTGWLWDRLTGARTPRGIREVAWRATHMSAYAQGYLESGPAIDVSAAGAGVRSGTG